MKESKLYHFPEKAHVIQLFLPENKKAGVVVDLKEYKKKKWRKARRKERT